LPFEGACEVRRGKGRKGVEKRRGGERKREREERRGEEESNAEENIHMGERPCAKGGLLLFISSHHLV
jgi:hypothetical protein